MYLVIYSSRFFFFNRIEKKHKQTCKNIINSVQSYVSWTGFSRSNKNKIGLEKFCPNNLKLRPFEPLMQVSLSQKRLLAPISLRQNFVKRTSRPSSCKLRLTLVQFDLRAILCKNQAKWEMKNFDLPSNFACN